MTEPEKPYTVVVGVSATSKSPTALVWGQAQAQANGGRLIAVRVHPMPHSPQEHPGTTSWSASGPHPSRDQQQAQLERDVADVLGADHGAETPSNPQQQAPRPDQRVPRGGRACDRRAAGTVDVAAAGPADRVRRQLSRRGHAPVDLRASRVLAVPVRPRPRAGRSALGRHQRPSRLPPARQPGRLSSRPSGRHSARVGGASGSLTSARASSSNDITRPATTLLRVASATDQPRSVARNE